jgi:hypothetical protein
MTKDLDIEAGKPEQEIQARTARTGWPEQGSRDGTVRTEQLGQDYWNGKTGQGSRDSTTGTGYIGQNNKASNRTAWIGQPGQDIWNRTA